MQSWQILKYALICFFDDQCVRSSAALSFFALFSLAPMIMIAIQVASLLAADIDFQQQVTDQFSQLIGSRGAQGIGVLIDSLEGESSSVAQLLVGTTVLLFSATSIFVQLQTSFNNIYSVRVRQGKNLLKQLLNRLISLGMILSLGFVMITSLIIDSLIVFLEEYLQVIFSDYTNILVVVVQYTVLVSLIYLVIYSLFNYLPDVNIRTDFKLKGAAVITALLAAGKFAIGWYIGNSQFSELGGASASILVLMIWIYYSSLILFFGAELIKSMAHHADAELTPRRFAIRIKSIEVDETS